MFKKLFSQLRQAGEDFTLTELTDWVSNTPKTKDASAEDKKQAGGVVGLAAGGFLRTAGFVLTGIALLSAIATPLGLATVTALGFAAATGAGTVFAQGMIDGGDKATGLYSGAKAFKGEVWSEISAGIKKWGGAKLGPVFGRSAKAEQEPAVKVEPLVKPQPQQQNKL